jgi:Uma2 family endonuclease
VGGPVVKKHGATVEDFLAIPEGERFHELIDGDIVEKAVPSGEHGGAQAAIVIELGGHFSRRWGRRPGGWWFATEVEVRFAADVCRPDVLGWRRERVPEPPRGQLVPIAPDWTCEVLSSSNKRNDLVRKKRIYHRHRVGHYWIVDPDDQTLAVYRWHDDGYLEVLVAESGQTVRAEPFDAIEIPVGVLFGEIVDATIS